MKPTLWLKHNHGLTHSQAKIAIRKGFVSTKSGALIRSFGECAHELIYRFAAQPSLKVVKAAVEPVVAPEQAKKPRPKKKQSFKKLEN